MFKVIVFNARYEKLEKEFEDKANLDKYIEAMKVLGINHKVLESLDLEEEDGWCFYTHM